MNIGIIGLGLIGGSMAKTLKEKTSHTVYGKDILPEVIIKARLIGAIDDELDDELLSECDMVILSLYPRDIVDYVQKNADKFKKGAIVMDCCGIKRLVCDKVKPLVDGRDFIFMGGHPMAGIEKWGFENARGDLFEGASMIITPFEDVDIKTLIMVKELFLQMGFAMVRVSTPKEHDLMIAYTSQLAHVLSSAYVKSPSALEHVGFSAGSFKDMTRVAKLNENMWTELFMVNSDNLLGEIDALIDRLCEYRDAMKNKDEKMLCALLKEGRERKEFLEKRGMKA